MNCRNIYKKTCCKTIFVSDTCRLSRGWFEHVSMWMFIQCKCTVSTNSIITSGRHTMPCHSRPWNNHVSLAKFSHWTIITQRARQSGAHNLCPGQRSSLIESRSRASKIHDWNESNFKRATFLHNSHEHCAKQIGCVIFYAVSEAFCHLWAFEKEMIRGRMVFRLWLM